MKPSEIKYTDNQLKVENHFCFKLSPIMTKRKQSEST